MHMGQKVQSGVYKGQSVSRLIFGMFEVGKAYRIDLKLCSTEMSKLLKLAF